MKKNLKPKTKPYKLKHKKTGLYFKYGTLSESGQIYRHSNNYCTYLGKERARIIVDYYSEVYMKHKEILDELDEFKHKKIHLSSGIGPIVITICADDFEKEYIQLKNKNNTIENVEKSWWHAFIAVVAVVVIIECTEGQYYEHNISSRWNNCFY